MTLCLDLREIQDRHAPLTGGKAFALARLLQHDFAVPDGLCILTEAYRRFVDTTPVAERIRMELSRKEFRHMRWEELWDAALRIRHLFNSTPFPPEVERALTERIEQATGDGPAAVRSSAIGEDSGELSFAGLHESVLNVAGTGNILEQVKNVWASLWSDAALLYRQELGLEVERSAMAVLIQRFVPGDCSGVIFSQSPLDPEVAVIEAVFGLAKGLVDGTVEPERWEIERSSTRIRSHRSSSENRRVVAAAGGTRIVSKEGRTGEPLLSNQQIQQVYDAGREAERLFGSPQDVEWTFGSAGLQLLQARPITAKKQDRDEKRVWSLSLRRSYENLEALRAKIEDSILPGMEEEADELSTWNPAESSDIELAGQLELRQAALDRWTDAYWDDLIPFAHGMRLFGQVYNDAVGPEDPFAFVVLLRPQRLESIERNRLIRQMAERIRSQPRLRRLLLDRPLSKCDDGQLLSQLEIYHFRYGNLLGIQADRDRLDEYLRTLLLEMSDPDRPLNVEQELEDREEMEKQYLDSFEEEDRKHARELLELGRASYRIRDDDNIYLDRFKGLVREAEEVARQRLQARGLQEVAQLPGEQLIQALRDPAYRPRIVEAPPAPTELSEVDARQLLGQPASHGIATGRARVIRKPEELFGLQKGEVLVCDAIDPAMTFVAPLAAAIVERRGGMLIHGAIIAREYGIPCVTGIPEATERIASGDRLTVDGYLGIVAIDSRN
jgi:phosphohistidine swiveling domain-containing protein